MGMAVKCTECDKKYANEDFLTKHIAEAHPIQERKQKGWATPYGFVDFREPVTYAEALKLSKTLAERFKIPAARQLEDKE